MDGSETIVVEGQKGRCRVTRQQQLDNMNVTYENFSQWQRCLGVPQQKHDENCEERGGCTVSCSEC
jgi:hypothetical protein